mmetsp:Transcript_9294/g.13975  ORF Transcript_9294/g.13975 Transcript_9294/m.13975 type:complete len:380 (-) Transcript_9294:52-1191(-)
MQSKTTSDDTAVASSQEINEEKLKKYLKLLKASREKIIENEAIISNQTVQIEKLSNQIDQMRKRSDRYFEDLEPISALCRIDSDGMVWILFEFLDDDSEDESLFVCWKKFMSEDELEDFLKDCDSSHIELPLRMYSKVECEIIKDEAEKRVSAINDDFRKYRINVELTRQKTESEVFLRNRNSSQAMSLRDGSSERQEEIDELKDEISRMKSEFSRAEHTWKTAYEKQEKIIEELSNRGNEAELASQWRQRYEHVLKEKDEISARLEMLTSPNHQKIIQIEKQYQNLKDEFKNYKLRNAPSYIEETSIFDPKTQYLRNLLLNYMGTENPAAKNNMERAICKVLDFSEEELGQVEEKRRKEEEFIGHGPSGWITNILGKN